jgi:hypothetical protein
VDFRGNSGQIAHSYETLSHAPFIPIIVSDKLFPSISVTSATLTLLKVSPKMRYIAEMHRKGLHPYYNRVLHGDTLAYPYS